PRARRRPGLPRRLWRTGGRLAVMGARRGYVPRHAYARTEVPARHAARPAAGGHAMTTARASALDAEVARLDDLGLLGSREAAERVFRLIGALAALRKAHGFDARGRCKQCRPARWWRRRRACTVADVFAEYGIGRIEVSSDESGRD